MTPETAFAVQRPIHVISTSLWLGPGDLISTDGPSGVAAGFEPPKWPKPGDTIEIEAPEIGVLRTGVLAET